MDREISPDRESQMRHQHSWAESGRLSVPMWDSSDPERAPPPLPLNPTQSPTTRANTSAGIAAAAKQIVERARESQPLSTYTSNRDSLQSSPEKSLVKGAHHRRLQSMATPGVKDLRNFLNNRSPERSPERPSSRSRLESLSRQDSGEDLPSPFERSATPTPMSRDPLKDTPSLRPSSRPGPRPLLGENTPPSATMLALQTMQVPEQPLNDITNGPSTPTPSHAVPETNFSSQLLNLTSIATSLQKEMAQLSRRSKDNATDLISLKEATNQRDEDIRKSLRDLTSNFSSASSLLGAPPMMGPMSRSTSSYANFLDNKPFSSPPSATKSYSVPRASSVPTFMEDNRVGSPSPYSVEGAASVAMLEKIIREMVTKEGQERLQSSLSELLEKSHKENSDAARKVEELSAFIKSNSQSQALVPASRNSAPRLELNFETSPGMHQKTREGSGKEGRMISADDEIVKMLQRIKDSISHSGGTTSEVKGLVRDLRGEVLGMGRELGQKLEKVSEASLDSALDRSIENGQGNVNTEEMQRIVEEGLNELKVHMSDILRHHAAREDDSFKQLATTRSGPDGDEIVALVKHALTEHHGGSGQHDIDIENVRLDRDGVLDAVKEGLKDFEPNIELQQFGLERDEILTVLKEGLEDYQSRSQGQTVASIDKGELYEVMQEAIKDFRAPVPQDQITLMKDEMLANVREALTEHQLANDSRSLPGADEVTRLTIVDAVREAVASHGPSAPRELEISREDLFDAVKASLDGSSIPFGGLGDQVLSQLRELFDNMKFEFHEYTAANGRDTEQVLDAVKDGLEALRADIESYVDRAQDVTGKDEIIGTVKDGLESLRGDVQGYIAIGPVLESGKDEMMAYIKAEFEHLHAALGDRGPSREVDDSKPLHTAEIILALKEGVDELKSHVNKSRGLDDENGEEIREALKDEFEQLKTAILNANAHDKTELVETIQDSMGVLHAKMNGTELSDLTGGATEDIIQEMHSEFGHLKETMHSIIGDGDREVIVTGVKQAIDDLRIQLSADQSDASAETLGAIREELERFRTSVGESSLPNRGLAGSDLSDETLSTLRSGLEEIKETTARSAITDEMLEAIRGEFENLRNSINSSMVHANPNEEVLDAIRLGLDDLTSHVDKKLDNPEHTTSLNEEFLDTINDGFETLRTDIVKTLDKPLDMTVNYEILDTLKDGLAELRINMDKLRSGSSGNLVGGEIVLADEAEVGHTRDLQDGVAAAGSGNHRSDFEKMEVLLTQLQIKVEAMHASVQDLPATHSTKSTEGAVIKDDLVALEIMLRDIQDSVAGNLHSGSASGNAATKEDTDAIETLLRNTKAQLEEMGEASSANGIGKDQLDEVEAVVRLTNTAIDDLSERLENSTAAKADVAVVEVLAQDLKAAIDELKERIPVPDPNEVRPEPMTKADLDVLGIMCTEIKTRVNEMELPNPEELPSKADIEQLHGLINDFRESHDKMRESYENDIGVTAKAFDDRRQEFEDTVQQITEVKDSLTGLRDDLLSKIGNGEITLDDIGELLRTVEAKADHGAVATDVKEVLEKLAFEFEIAHGTLQAIKTGHKEASETVLVNQVEHRDYLAKEMGDKLETYFDGLMSKYDDAQQAAEERAKVMQDKSLQQEEILSSTKSMAEDLRISIDTLGATLTGFTSSFPETIEKMTEESKTVYNKIDDTYNKLDETQEGLKFEHSVTREELAKMMAAIGGLHGDVSEHNPRFMVALREVQALIQQHYEHSQKVDLVAAEHTQAMRDLQEQMRGLGAQNEEFKLNASAQPALTVAPAETTSGGEKYDDSALHRKLDELLGHSKQAPSASEQLERLDMIHEKVMATAAEVSVFVAAQTRHITEDHENKEKESEELALLLERRNVQKDEIEADITVLNEEKEVLQTAVEALRAEKEALMAQKAHLSADVSSLETAMHIRREELHGMDRKAEVIERRILEGVMNQSRMLLLTNSGKSSPKKKPQGRDLRIPSTSSAASAQTVTSSVPALRHNHSLALKTRPGVQRGNALPNTTERRIMSLSQIHTNAAAGRGMSPVPSLASSGLGQLKRSHSVKAQAVVRKPSWGGKRDLSFGSYNKENETLSEEAEEDDFERPVSRDETDFTSETGGNGRESYLSSTDSGVTYNDASSVAGGATTADDDYRRSHRASELSYETGSYATESEIYENASAMSSANGVVGIDFAPFEAPAEHANDDAMAGAEQETPLQIEGPPLPYQGDDVKHDGGVWRNVTDSGLGTDVPTAALSSVGGDGGYFKE